MKLMNMNDIKPIERDDLIWNKENELFNLLGVTDKQKSKKIRGLFNEIIQQLIVRTDNIFSDDVK